MRAARWTHDCAACWFEQFTSVPQATLAQCLWLARRCPAALARATQQRNHAVTAPRPAPAPICTLRHIAVRERAKGEALARAGKAKLCTSWLTEWTLCTRRLQAHADSVAGSALVVAALLQALPTTCKPGRNDVVVIARLARDVYA